MKNMLDADFLIFDLGNVIIDIDYNKSFELISSQVSHDLHDKVQKFYLTDFHLDYEKGLIDSATFRNEVREYFEQDWEDEKVDFLWNSLLGEIPSKRLELIFSLKNKYQLGVLSNTNEIHITALNEILKSDHQIENLDIIFHQVFLSHELGLSKPSKDIYEKMVSELDTTPERVIFFDDLEKNVKGAAAIGIRAVHVTGPSVIFDYLKNA
jgi:putative hydrolase of the HAD superfamily